MGGPAWLTGALVAAVLAIAAYSVGRLAVAAATGRRSERDVDAFHVAMAISMVYALANRLTPFSSDAWAVLFACTTVWFGLRLPWAVVARDVELHPVGHRLAHVVSSGAMVYMLLAPPAGPGGGMTGMAGMAGMAPARLPVLGVLLAVALLAAAAVNADEALVGRGRQTVPALELSLVRQGQTAATASTAEVRSVPVPQPLLTPRLAAAAQVVMGVVMAYMLITMV